MTLFFIDEKTIFSVTNKTKAVLFRLLNRYYICHNTKHLTLNSSNLPQKPITSAITQLPGFCHTGRNPAGTRQKPGSCVMADVIPVDGGQYLDG
jgi:hypothetical protein